MSGCLSTDMRLTQPQSNVSFHIFWSTASCIKYTSCLTWSEFKRCDAVKCKECGRKLLAVFSGYWYVTLGFLLFAQFLWTNADTGDYFVLGHDILLSNPHQLAIVILPSIAAE